MYHVSWYKYWHILTIIPPSPIFFELFLLLIECMYINVSSCPTVKHLWGWGSLYWKHMLWGRKEGREGRARNFWVMDAIEAENKLQTNRILCVVAVDGCIHVQWVCEGFGWVHMRWKIWKFHSAFFVCFGLDGFIANKSEEQRKHVKR